MKKVINLFAVFSLIAVLVACSKDKDSTSSSTNNSTSNELKIGADTYVLTSGMLEDYGTDSAYAGTNFDIFLLSDGVSLDVNGDLQGTGYLVYFESFTTTSTGIESGTYTYDSSSLTVNTFDEGQIVKVENGNAVDGYTVTSGSYVVDNKGSDKYKISGTLSAVGTTSGATTITFSYEGTFSVN